MVLSEPETASVGLDLARDQLSEQLSGADADDVKSLGFLAADIAGVVALVSVHRELNRFWWISTLAFVVAAGLLIWALRRQDFRSGPDPLEVYFSASPTPALDAINGLQTARRDIVDKRSQRRRVYQASLVVFVISMVGSTVSFLVVH